MEELDDREFHQKVVAKKVTQSGDRDPNLWAKFFVNSAPLACISQYCASPDHSTSECTYDNSQSEGQV